MTVQLFTFQNVINMMGGTNFRPANHTVVEKSHKLFGLIPVVTFTITSLLDDSLIEKRTFFAGFGYIGRSELRFCKDTVYYNHQVQGVWVLHDD